MLRDIEGACHDWNKALELGFKYSKKYILYYFYQKDRKYSYFRNFIVFIEFLKSNTTL